MLAVANSSGGSFAEPPLGSKVCRACLVTKCLEEDFYASTRHEDGSVKTWQPYCKECMRVRVRNQARKRRRKLGVSVRGAYGPRGVKLRPEPFIAWLNQQPNIAALSRAAGIDESRLRRLKNGNLSSQKKLTIDFVDRILVASGGDTTIDDLYGD